IAVAVDGPSAIVEYQKIAGAGQPLWNEMRMMLAENLSQRPQWARLAIIRTHPPRERAGRPIDDPDDARGPAADDDVVRMETFVAGVVPLVGSEIRRGVHVQPVTAAAVLQPAREPMNRVPGLFAQSEVVDVVAGQPVPEDLAVPAHLDEPI